MKAIRIFLLSKYFWWAAFILHLLVLGLLYLKFGFSFSNESEKYLAIAQRLNCENFRDELRYLWSYSSYILFLALCFKLGFSVYIILVIQYIISITGFYLFYKFIVSQSFFSELYSRICFLLITTCPIILYWQLTFYTESVFPGLVMISTYYFFKLKTNPFVSILLSASLLFCRPVGVFYVIALQFVGIRRKNLSLAKIFLYGSLTVVFLIVFFFLPVHYSDFALPIYQGSVICGFPAHPGSILPVGNYTLAQVYLKFIEDFGFSEFLEIMIKKAGTFFTITRSYYSLSHNLINSLYYPFIFGGILGYYKIMKSVSYSDFKGYFSGVFLGSLLIVALIYNEWSERFIVPLLPFFILLTLFFVKKAGFKTVV